METDATALRDGAVLEADLCVIGAGPAGLTLARELLPSGLRICVLESGGHRPDSAIQQLCDGTTDGDPYGKLIDMRCRQTGGTVNIWNVIIGSQRAAKYLPLDPIDLEERPWLPFSGWPFDHGSLRPFYERAQALCDLGPFTYRAEDWVGARCRILSLPGHRLITSVYQFGLGQVFSHRLVDEIRRAQNVHLYLHIHAVGLAVNRSGDVVTAIHAACLDGRQFLVRAKAVVLAAGAIENARLLLLFNGTSSGRLGNQHDLVGRYFMEHPRDASCVLVPQNAEVADIIRGFYGLQRTPHGIVMGRLTLHEAALRHEHLLNASIQLVSPPPSRWPAVSLRWRRPVSSYTLLINVEQPPDPNNRVILDTARRDALGLPQVRVRWRWGAENQKSLERMKMLLADEVERAGIGRITIQSGLPPDPNMHHHVGTTRMHPDSRFGVVDENGRVHGVSNLFVASSSVFPTGGCANPTLTIVALTLRLADHLKAFVRAGAP